MTRGITVLIALVFLSACSSAPVYYSAPLSFQLAKPKDSKLAAYVEDQLSGESTHSSFTTAVYPIGDGIDAFVARLALIEAATVSVDVQYYLFHNDDTGRLLTWYLFKAAERGVRVRLLLDDMTTKGMDDALMRLIQHPNIYVRIFNPDNERTFRNLSFISNLDRLNHRMHNKSLNVDNLFAVVGGRNIGNEYYAANKSVNFSDLDLLLMGKVVDEVATQFDLYWNSSQVRPIGDLVTHSDVKHHADIHSYTREFEKTISTHPYVLQLTQSELLSKMLNKEINWYWAEAELVYDPPNKLKQLDNPILLDDLAGFFAKAQEEIIILSPYFVPTKQGTNDIISAVKSGKSVTIITNSLAASDVPVVHAGYIKYREDLVKAGVTIYELKASSEVKSDPKVHRSSGFSGSAKSSLHAKSFILDRQHLFVGSFNFDPRSFWINTEMGVVVEQAPLSEQLAQGILNNIAEHAYQVIYHRDKLQWFDEATNRYLTTEPDTSWWQRVNVKVLSWLPIENQL